MHTYMISKKGRPSVTCKEFHVWTMRGTKELVSAGEGSIKQKWFVSAWSSAIICVQNARKKSTYDFEHSVKVKVESVLGMLNCWSSWE